MFNGVPQSTAKLIPTLRELNVLTFRVDGLFEDAATLRRKVKAYAALLFNNVPITDAMEQLGLVERYGITDGQLYNIRGYQDRKKPFTGLSELEHGADPGLREVVSSR